MVKLCLSQIIENCFHLKKINIISYLQQCVVLDYSSKVLSVTGQHTVDPKQWCALGLGDMAKILYLHVGHFITG